MILYTGHSQYFGQDTYFTEHPVLTVEFAELLVRKQVKMVGMDMPSPDKYPFEVHKCLFHNRVLIIENLTNLDQLLHAESFEIIALPLHIRADSSVARVIAKVK
ncbi:cyclase family protein [Paenibacillus sp. KN14-4R]|uniref:cyclase family protein n=1 Tax=Paenibacillus sp. KN14-4R TaxID=3445773 RepID=UPI003F9FE0E4